MNERPQVIELPDQNQDANMVNMFMQEANDIEAHVAED